jgi:predicted MFS family arabinose efflux permease
MLYGGSYGSGPQPDAMTTSSHLMRRRRFLPLFCTQLLNAFNDNLYKTAMVLFVVYVVYNDPRQEFIVSAAASLLFILPFFLFSAIAGQLADMRDKAKIIRTVKMGEMGLMLLGATGLYITWSGAGPQQLGIAIMMFALFLTGIQSTFLGPIKYAILPQHLKKDEVLSGTGLVEAGTYVAILLGTILAGWIKVETATWLILIVSVCGYLTSKTIPDAPPLGEVKPIDFNIWRSSVHLIRSTVHDRQIFLAIIAISFFWTIGAVLFIQFPPLAKNVLYANPQVASLFLVMFSVGVAIGSIGINALLKGKVSARHAPASVIVMGLCVIAFYLTVRFWNGDTSSGLLDIPGFLAQPLAIPLLASLLAIAIAGGFFVVPLYAFLTTRSKPDAAARTIAANNIVNSGAMVGGSLVSLILGLLGVDVIEQVLMSAVMCLISAYLARNLLRAERAEQAAQ